MQYVKLSCGCKLPIVNGKLHIDYNNLNHNCQKTWKLYADGHTRSIFQLESRLCRTWAKELNPTSIKDAADLIAIVRPGTLHSEDENGRSMTNVFCKRKTGQEIYDTVSPLARLLIDTYNILVYQEQLMYISKQLAGFDGKNANKLMKSIGKKDAALLFSLETQFVEGCVKHGILNRAEAIEAFTNIKHSARYMFNKCVCPKTTFVETETATKSIEELAIGEFVKSPDGFIEVVDKFCTGTKDLYEIELDSGKKIRCTMDHKFLCNDGKVHALSFILENNLEICEEN